MEKKFYHTVIFRRKNILLEVTHHMSVWIMDLDTSHFEIPLVQKLGGRILFLKSVLGYQKVQAAIKLEGGGGIKKLRFFRLTKP